MSFPTYSLRPLLCRERVELTGSLDNGRHNVAIWLNWIVLFDLNQEMSASDQKLPAARPRNVCLHPIYSYRHFATSGGVISYGPDPIDQYRRAAGCVDRVPEGEKPP